MLVSSENFENGRTPGWVFGRTDFAPAFTRFLGRYGKNDGGRYPSKVFHVPRNAKELVLEFDFYEIDSWDKSHRDYLCIVFDGKMVDIETFDTHQSENGRGTTRNGVRFQVRSLTNPANIGFAHWNDQKHRITMDVSPLYYQADGQIKIEFQARLNEAIHNESAGYDNIKLTASYGCRRRKLRGNGDMDDVAEDEVAVVDGDSEEPQYFMGDAVDTFEDDSANYL